MNVFVKLTKPILEDEGIHVFLSTEAVNTIH